jgi:Domain of Unknown Function (DUF1080)
MRLLFFCLVFASYLSSTFAQNNPDYTQLNAWKSNITKNWQTAGSVSARLGKPENMTAVPGQGILVNLPDKKNRANLVSIAEYGDVEVSFDFMMAEHSNSGFYLQGRYEVQLLDSWGVLQPTFGDCGGIYKRRRYVPHEELFDGHAPSQNTALAPGLWQHMEIGFDAPRFNGAGNKTANARIRFVRLNGVTVQENIELTGPTGGPISEQEAPKGPFMIQGDHGPVAFRNFNVRDLGGSKASLSGVAFTSVHGSFRDTAEFKGKQPNIQTTTKALTWEAGNVPSNFGNCHKATLTVPTAGQYTFRLQAAGNSILRVNHQVVLKQQWTYSADSRTGTIDLPAGQVPFEIIHFNMDSWMPPILACWVSGPGFGETPLHTLGSQLGLIPADPIYLKADVPRVFRSFMDYKVNEKTDHRITHAVQVGHPKQLHYTYNMSNGAIPQIWKGDFLYTSPMWDNRGDGSSRPLGTVLTLGDFPALVKGDRIGDTSTVYEASANFRPLGYDLKDAGVPVFRYELYGATITDEIIVGEGGKNLMRNINIDGKNLDTKEEDKMLWVRMAVAPKIQKLVGENYMIGDHAYYISIMPKYKAKIVNTPAGQVLMLPVLQDKYNIDYTIMR